MVRFLILLFVVFPLTAGAVYAPGQVGTVTIGGVTLSTTNLKILKTTLTTNNRSVFYDTSYGGSPAVYSPTNPFHLQAFHCDLNITSTAGGYGELLYADNNAGINVTTSLTNPVGVITGVATGNLADYLYSGLWSSFSIKEGAVGGKVPASKFIYLDGSSFAVCFLYGYEA